MLFLTVHLFQKIHIRNLEKDIKNSAQSLKATPDLDKVLTIQNQLNSLPALHDEKPVTSRLFGYLGQVTPAQVSIGKLDLDFETTSLIISGNADSLSTVNKFVDTLKFTTYKVDGSDQKSKPFTEVVLTNFGRSDKEATYQISLKFDKTIFDILKKVSFEVPKIISSRSETEKPTDLFKALPTEGQQ